MAGHINKWHACPGSYNQAKVEKREEEVVGR